MNTSEFKGFPEQGMRFLKDLKANNNRDWFQQHKAEFKRFIEAPARDFSTELALQIPRITREVMSSKIFRIYRDVRFSKDKTPYNTDVHISFFHAGTNTSSGLAHTAFYFALEPDKVVTGVGCFEFSKQALIAYRNAVDKEKSGQSLAKVLNHFVANNDYRLDAPGLKRVPAGYQKDHPRATLLRRKGLVIWHEQKHNTTLYSKGLIDKTMHEFENMKPVHDWLKEL